MYVVPTLASQPLNSICLSEAEYALLCQQISCRYFAVILSPALSELDHQLISLEKEISNMIIGGQLLSIPVPKCNDSRVCTGIQNLSNLISLLH